MLIRISFIIAFVFLSSLSYSQKIENVHAKQEGNQVVITYNLSGAESGQKFYVSLYYSQNGYNWNQSIYGLTGDIGNDVVPGNTKTIIWDVVQDVDRLTGSGFIFKVKASLIRDNVTLNESVKIETMNFTGTSGNFVDTRDNKSYKWIKIGDQIWMAENLNFKTIKGSYCYDSKSSNCDLYGRLYDWEVAMNACPNGWHLPDDDEYISLTNFLGKDSGGKLKQAGVTNWQEENKGGNNLSKFNALPGGYRRYNGEFVRASTDADFWSSSEIDTEFAHHWDLHYNSAKYFRTDGDKRYGLSVRCIKD